MIPSRAALAAGYGPAFLVPGDMVGIEAIGGALRELAAVVDEAGRSLSRVEVTRWRGQAADGWRDVMTVEPGRWWSAADALARAAVSLDGYATSLAAARVVAEAALELWLASSSAPGVSAAIAESTGQCPSTQVSTAAMHAGRERAVAMLDSARAAVDDAGRLAARSLGDAMAEAPEARRFYQETIRPAGMTEPAHLALDGLGLLPLVGFVPDLLNAGWYAGEGRYVEAGLSAASAIPGPGDVLGAGVLAGTAGVKAVKRIGEIDTFIKDSHETALGRGELLWRLSPETPGVLFDHVPYGFSSRESWESFSKQVHDQIAAAGIQDADVYLRGSAVTGIQHSSGKLIGDTGPGDLDFAIVDNDLVDRLKTMGLHLRTGQSRTPPLSPNALDGLGLSEARLVLSEQAGIKVSFMAYRDGSGVLARGDAILLP